MGSQPSRFFRIVAPLVLASSLVVARASADASATAPLPPDLSNVGVDEHLGATIPLDVTFRDHRGQDVRLRELVRDRPVVLNLMYHRCSMLCSIVLDALADSLRELEWSVGEKFDVITLSIDPQDTSAVATRKREQILERYGRPSAERGWHFLVGDEAAIRRIAQAVGFEYRWDATQRQWIHPAAIFLLTSDGRIARYLYGVEFPPQEVRFALLEASEGRSITTTERILLFCYHYDATGRRYTLLVPRIMRATGVVLLVAVSGLLGVMWRRDRLRRTSRTPSTDRSGERRA
jgi:protein SCO1/2